MRQQRLGSVFLPAIVSSLGLVATLTSCGQSASAPTTQAAPAARPLTVTVAGTKPSARRTEHTKPLHYSYRMQTPVLHDGVAPHGASLRAAVIQAVQSEAKGVHAAAMAKDGSSVHMESPEQSLSATIDSRGIKVQASQTGTAHDIGFRLSGYGCASSVSAFGGDSQLRASGPRGELDHGGVVEWYQNGRLGLEQGFDLNSAPGCRSGAPADRSDAVVLELTLDHKLQAELMENRGEQWLDLRDASGEVVLRYSDLYAEDATQKPLPVRMALSGKKLSLRVDDRGATYPVRVDPLIWAQVGGAQKAATPHAADQFGLSVAVSGDHAAVGSPHDGDGGVDAGAGYIFQLSSQGVWTQQVKFIGPQAGALMGSATAIDDAGGGNKRAVFGQPGDTDGTSVFGSAAWFVGVGSSFTEDAVFGGIGSFGTSVAASGGRIVVGGPTADPTTDPNDGYAVIYTPDGSQTPPWSEDAILFGGLGSGEKFGSAVGLSLDLAVIGAPGNTSAGANTGAAYIYQRNSAGGGWSLKASLVGSDTAMGDMFGASVAISGQTALIGAPAKGGSIGGAYAFTSVGGVWKEQQKLHALFTGTLKTGDAFGTSVSIASNLAAIGAPGTDSGGQADSGAVYVLTRSGTTWSLKNVVTAKTPAANERFGTSVSVESTGVRILVGAPGYDGGTGANTGAFYEIIQRKQNGDPCLAATECASDFCVDGFCCDQACGGGTDNDCQACAVSKGAAVNGTCAMASMGAAFVCRPSAGTCDTAEVCTGASTQCPADAFVANTTVCRAAVAGGCDTDEFCTGSTAACPADVVKPMGTMCRASKGECDVAEICNGVANTCPGDAKVPMGLVCRAAVGLCDKPETCDGSTDTCPTDTYLGSGTVCRPSAGSCDTDEVCGGSSPNCPTDAFLPNSTVCRPAIAGGCDVAEKCTGTAAACPMDVVAAANTVCRAAADVCDSKEVCDGSSGACPGDTKVAAGVTCRAAAGACDIAEACDGSTNACPTDKLATSATVCRPTAGICDVAESCDGVGVNCPADAFVPSTTVCRPAVSATCDVAESCSGTAAACPTDVVMPANTVCRAAVGLCDAKEVCDGSSGACPGDTKIAAGVTCRPAAGVCDIAEACDGTADACPMDKLATSATVCRPVAGICDVAESCTGAAVDCPTDSFVPSTTVCRPSAGVCDVVEQCTGAAAACPSDTVLKVGTSCRASAGACDVAETCDGLSGACPSDFKVPMGVNCRPAAGDCDSPESCDGVTDACPADVFMASTTVCRPATGPCDIVEQCTGSTPVCPADALHPMGFTCRAQAGICDIAELCDGKTGDCSDDLKVPSGMACRPSVGICDLTENCDGMNNDCPADVFAGAAVTCRPAVDDCDVPDVCDTTGASCPADVKAANNTACSAGSCQAAICRVESDLVVAAAPAPVYTGPEPDLAFTIGVGNVGRSPTTDVVLTVQVPAGTVLVKANGDSWGCEVKSDTEIECRRATLGVSENTLVSLSLRPPAAAESFDLTANVVSTIFDPVTGNNTAKVSQSLLTPRYSGGGVSCSVAVGSAPARNAGPVGSMLLLLGMAGLLTIRRRRSS